MLKCCLFVEDKMQVSIFFPYIRYKRITNIDLSSKLPLRYRVNLTTSRVFNIHCLLCLCWNREYLVAFKTNLFNLSSSFKLVPKYILFLVKLFLQWASIDLSSKLSFTCGGNVNCYKSFHHPIPSLHVGIGYTLEIFQTNQ